MTAPSIKEALEAVEPYLDAITCYASSINEHEGNRVAKMVRAALATLSPPAGERREAIARMIDDLLQADCDYEHAPKWDEKSKYEALKAARSSLDTAIDALAYGLVQDEAAIRADEREKQRERDANFVANWFHPDSKNLAERLASAIRSARDGGAES